MSVAREAVDQKDVSFGHLFGMAPEHEAPKPTVSKTDAEPDAPAAEMSEAA